MRHSNQKHTKRGSGRVWALPIVPFAVFLALVLPIGAGAGVKEESSDPTFRLPTVFFGIGKAVPASNVALDENDKDKEDKNKEDKDKDKDKDGKHDEGSGETGGDLGSGDTGSGGEDPSASWSG